MSDWTLDPHVTLCFGAQRSGKTSFCIRYLLNVPAAAVFVFDDRGQVERRLGLRPATTERECHEALAQRWVVFNPARMWPPEKLQDAFGWFCKWVLDVSRTGPGKKVLFVDEAWQFLDARTAPQELENIVRTGRAEDLELMMATHRPSEYPRNVRALVTEWVCFNTVDENDLEAVRPYFAGVDACATLPKGQFISYNRESGASLAGKLF